MPLPARYAAVGQFLSPRANGSDLHTDVRLWPGRTGARSTKTTKKPAEGLGGADPCGATVKSLIFHRIVSGRWADDRSFGLRKCSRLSTRKLSPSPCAIPHPAV